MRLPFSTLLGFCACSCGAWSLRERRGSSAWPRPSRRRVTLSRDRRGGAADQAGRGVRYPFANRRLWTLTDSSQRRRRLRWRQPTRVWRGTRAGLQHRGPPRGATPEAGADPHQHRPMMGREDRTEGRERERERRRGHAPGGARDTGLYIYTQRARARPSSPPPRACCPSTSIPFVHAAVRAGRRRPASVFQSASWPVVRAQGRGR